MAALPSTESKVSFIASAMPLTMERSFSGTAARIPKFPSSWAPTMIAPAKSSMRGMSRRGFLTAPAAELISSKPMKL